MQLNNLKMQLSTEKVIMNVHDMLQLIQKIRAKVMLHDQMQIKVESKNVQDATRKANYES